MLNYIWILLNKNILSVDGRILLTKKWFIHFIKKKNFDGKEHGYAKELYTIMKM